MFNRLEFLLRISGGDDKWLSIDRRLMLQSVFEPPSMSSELYQSSTQKRGFISPLSSKNSSGHKMLNEVVEDNRQHHLRVVG